MLEFKTLGEIQLKYEGKNLQNNFSRKALGLIIYLSINGKQVSREFLAEFFWEGLSQARGMNNLRVTLSEIRKLIPNLLTIERHSVAISSSFDYWFDVNEIKTSQYSTEGTMGIISQKIASHVERNLGHYQGDFLEGFYIQGSSSFESWLVIEREHIRGLIIAQLQELIDFYIENADYQPGIKLLKKLLKLNPLLESAHRQLMRLFVYEDQREAALSQFQTCKQILKNELDIVPSTETKELFEAIRAGELDSPLVEKFPEPLPIFEEVTQQRPVFVGREDQLTQMEFHLEKALKGEGRTVLVSGEAGSGKTALVTEFARRALEKHQNLLVANGRCNAFSGQGDAYLPFHQVMEILCCIKNPGLPGAAEKLLAVFPQTLSTVLTMGSDLIDRLIDPDKLMSRAYAVKTKEKKWLDPLKKLIQSERKEQKVHNSQFLIEMCNRVLVTISRQNPLLIIFDDLQWVDNASSNLLFHLIRNMSDSHILIIGIYRPSEVFSKVDGPNPFEPLIHEVKTHHGDTEINLDSVSDIEAKFFVDAFLDSEQNQLDASFRENLIIQTGGHPLFITELMRAMQDQGDIKKLGGKGWVANSDLKWEKLPAQVEGVIEARLARLDDWSRELLEMASVVGEEFDSQILGQVLNREDREIHQTLVKKLGGQHRLVLEIGKKKNLNQTLSLFRFSHNLFQHYLYLGLGEGQQILSHKAIAEVFEMREPDNLQALAFHYSKAEEVEKAIHYLLLVADKARHQYAIEEAIDYYLQALEFIEDIGDQEKLSRTWLKLALTYQNNFEFKASDKAYAKAFSIQTALSETMRENSHPPAPHSLRIVASEPLTIDPVLRNDTHSWQIVSQLFSGLVKLSPKGNILPDVARSWEVLEGGSRYVFHLKEDVFWSDGIPVTAKDFEFAIKRILDPKIESPIAVFYYEIKNARPYHKEKMSESDLIGVYTKDDYTLEFKLDTPTPYFLQFLGVGSLPVPQHTIKKYGDNWTKTENIISNGAFKLASWTQGESLVLKKNPRYHGEYNGNLTYVEVTFPDQGENILQAYLDGKFDTLRSEFLTRDQNLYSRQYLSSEYFSAPSLGTNYLAFDTSNAPFNDPRIRRALALATDRTSLIRKAFLGSRSPANGGLLPPGMPGYSPNIGLPFDPDRARFLLAEGGFPTGKGFPVLEGIFSEQSSTFKKSHSLLLKILQGMWLDILGIHVNWTQVTATDYYYGTLNKKPQLLIGGWNADYNDPHNFFVDARWNRLADQEFLWGQQEYEGLIQKAEEVLNQEERINLYMEADRIIAQEVPVIPLYYIKTQGLQKPWVKGLIYSAQRFAYFKDVIIKEH